MAAPTVTLEDVQGFSPQEQTLLYARSALRALPLLVEELESDIPDVSERIMAISLAAVDLVLEGNQAEASAQFVVGNARGVPLNATSGILAVSAVQSSVAQPSSFVPPEKAYEFLSDSRIVSGAVDDARILSEGNPHQLRDLPLWSEGLVSADFADHTARYLEVLRESGRADIANLYSDTNDGKVPWTWVTERLNTWSAPESLREDENLEQESVSDPETQTKGPADEPTSTDPATSESPLLSMLADAAWKPGDEDLLGYDDYAGALADLIDNPDTTTPLTLAINAPWGAGKTSLAKMVEHKLTTKRSAKGARTHVTCWFNAWLYDEAPDLAAAFAGEVAKSANAERPWYRRLISPVPPSLLSPRQRFLRRTGAVAVAIVVLGVASYFLRDYVSPHVPTFIKTTITSILSALPASAEGPVSKLLGGIAALVAILGAIGKLLPFSKSLGRFVADRGKVSNDGSMETVRAQLHRLISQGTPKGSRFVIFIDDLERCRPPRPIEVMEVVSQLLADQDVVTVIVADMPAVAACAEIKYEALARRYQPSGGTSIQTGYKSQRQAYGRLYLQKIVQLQFDLPTQTGTKLGEVLRRLGASDQEQEPDPPPGKDLPSLWAPYDTIAVLADTTTSDNRDDDQFERAFSLAASQPLAWRRFVSRLIAAFWTPYYFAVRLGRTLGYPPSERRGLSPAGPVERIFRWLLRAGWVGMLGPAWAVVVLAGGVPLDTEAWLTIASPLWSFVFGFTLSFVLSLRAWRRDQKATESDRAAVDASDELADLDEEKLRTLDDAQLRTQFNLKTEGDVRELIRERLTLKKTSDQNLISGVSEEILQFIPPLPRSAKRFLNRLRLLNNVASRRGLIGPSEITRNHLAKWAVLHERWPELGHSIGTRPAAIKLLEQGALKDGDDYRKEVEGLATAYVDDDQLKKFLQTPTLLGEVIDSLARFEPSAYTERPLADNQT